MAVSMSSGVMAVCMQRCSCGATALGRARGMQSNAYTGRGMTAVKPSAARHQLASRSVSRAQPAARRSSVITAAAEPAAGPPEASAAPAADAEEQELLRKDPDRYYIRRALQLAQRGVGHTHPNPAVGSVIVLNGEVVGEGCHPKAGMPHAEVYALRGAGQKARGATAYVTLEPCAHYGRTPPCAVALVEAGVARVVVGVADPNPLVAGAGIKILQDAGIEVVWGVEEEACYEINREFMERMAAHAAEEAAGETKEEAAAKAVEEDVLTLAEKVGV